MREETLYENRAKQCKGSESTRSSKHNTKTNGTINPPKPKSASSWGTQLVKGFTGDKKTKLRISIPNMKPSLAPSEVPSQKNSYIPYHSRVKRSLMCDFPGSANVAQVHPHSFECHRIMSPSSHDLFLELDHLRSLLREARDKELVLQAELEKHKENPRVIELERELDIKRTEVENLISRIGSVESEKINLAEQLAVLASILECREENPRQEENNNSTDFSLEKRIHNKRPEMELVELRRLNKELQLEKRNLTFRISSAESQLAALAKITESETWVKFEAEASVLRHTNKNLSKQVEGLQVSRLNEVEELAYLRWENSCLRQELCKSGSISRQSMEVSDALNISPEGVKINGGSGYFNEKFPCRVSKSPSPQVLNKKKAGNMRKFMSCPPEDGEPQSLQRQFIFDKRWLEGPQEGRSSPRRHSISGPKSSIEDLPLNKRRQSDGFFPAIDGNTNNRFPDAKDNKNHLSAQNYDTIDTQSPMFLFTKHENIKASVLEVEKRALRVPNPPPRPSISVTDDGKMNGVAKIPCPPPPPPPPPKLLNRNTGVMRRAPQVAELYHSLMRRDSKKESTVGGISDAPNVASARSSMIGEIENRSSHLLAIKADVETQGEFVKSLIKEVNNAVYQDIDDVVAFVKWLDDELCFLVDERAVLKHFDWPEKKADTLREAAFGYRDLKKLESEVSSYEDDYRVPCDTALKKMVSLSEKMERSIYNLLRARDVLMHHCKAFQIPTDWMLDNGIISKVKFASVRLAKKYIKRVAMEIQQARGASDKDPALEYMLLQGVRFAFRIHQFAGGFDAETMQVFEELRNLAHVRNNTLRGN